VAVSCVQWLYIYSVGSDCILRGVTYSAGSDCDFHERLFILTRIVANQRTRLRPDERRAQLLTCALSAFAEHGLARATHSQVAERAHVSVSAVYSYFRTRDDLVSAVLDEVADYLDRIASETLGGRFGVYDALMALGHRFAQDALDQPDMLKVWLDWSTGVDGASWPRYLDVLDRLHDAAAAVFEQGKKEGVVSSALDAQAAARIYMGGGHTVALMQFAGVSRRELDVVIDQLARGAMGVGLGSPVDGLTAEPTESG